MVQNIEHTLCLMCMKEHHTKVIKERTKDIYKNEEIEYDTKMFFCPNTEEYYIPEDFIIENDKNMKDTYRKKLDYLNQ